MERIRTFIAITPPPKVTSQVGEILEKLQNQNSVVRWETPEKAHITLMFLGDIPQARVEEVAKAVSETANNFPKFFIRTDVVSYFYKDKAGSDSVIFLSIYDPAKNLRRLHKSLAQHLTVHEFSPSTHFSAHITIGRLKKQRYPHEQKRILSEIADTNIPRGDEFEVTHLNIYESISQGDGHRYHLLRSFDLTG